MVLLKLPQRQDIDNHYSLLYSKVTPFEAIVMFLFSISRVVSSSKSTVVDISGITDGQITITWLLLTVIVVKIIGIYFILTQFIIIHLIKN